MTKFELGISEQFPKQSSENRMTMFAPGLPGLEGVPRATSERVDIPLSFVEKDCYDVGVLKGFSVPSSINFVFKGGSRKRANIAPAANRGSAGTLGVHDLAAEDVSGRAWDAIVATANHPVVSNDAPKLEASDSREVQS